MDSKNQILSTLRANVREAYDMPDLSFAKRTFENPLEQFKKQLVEAAGAKWIEMNPGDDINAVVRAAYPEAKLIAGEVEGLKADINPDLVDDARELDGIDVAIVDGGVACAENACVWIPMNMRQKALCFIAESLVIIVDKTKVVSNMHEAYAALETMGETSRYGFGTFISGPSKTADIEQSLVYGAQAAKSVTVILK